LAFSINERKRTMSDNYLISNNPAKNYEEVGRVAVSTATEVEAAVRTAREVQGVWGALTVNERCVYFENFRNLIKSNFEELARLQTQEMGKPLSESRGECKGILHWLKWQIAHAPEFLAPRILDTYKDRAVNLHFEPYGVAAVVAPWNFPTYQFVLNSAQILLGGNTVVLKHSEECPLTAQFLTSLMQNAGFPEGVFQCVYGDGELGRELLKQEINLISFTGSSQAGKQVYQQAAKKFIPALLEMGGSSPGVVFEDADLEMSCQSVYNERFANCGQVCCALKRLIVHESIHDEVVAKIRNIIESQVVGDPLDEGTTIGPLAAKRQLELLEEQVADARKLGATIVTGGERLADLSGAFYRPTLITDIPEECRIIREEVFGPVLSVQKFSDEREAVKLANDTPYGLSAFIYTGDAERGTRVARQLQAGQISINGCSTFSDRAPFGGYKESGLGRNDGEFGYYGVTQMKVIAQPNEWS